MANVHVRNLICPVRQDKRLVCILQARFQYCVIRPLNKNVPHGEDNAAGDPGADIVYHVQVYSPEEEGAYLKR